MLIGIPAILGPELLATLRAMGHGDEIAVVDGNYPALEDARRHILKLPQSELETIAWQVAIEALLIAAGKRKR